MTSAPMSPRSMLQKGPARMRVRSTTRTPDRGKGESPAASDTLEEAAVLDEDAPALLGPSDAVDVVVVLREALPVLLVGGEARKVDQGEGGVGGPRVLRRQPVPHEGAPAPGNDAAERPRVALEVRPLPRVDRIANAQCDHGLSSDLGSRLS